MRFLKRWLVPILAALMIAGIVVSFVPLTRQAEARAQAELTVLMSRAFTRIEEGAHLTEPVLDGGEESLLSKATAVARFLAHDDALLASDALLAPARSSPPDRIDIADARTLIASSTKRASAPSARCVPDAGPASDESAALTKVDETVQSSSTPASDGRISKDLCSLGPNLMCPGAANADAETLIADLPYGQDVSLSGAEAAGGRVLHESDTTTPQKDGKRRDLIAARPTSRCWPFDTPRNSRLASRWCETICGIAAYLRLDSVIPLEKIRRNWTRRRCGELRRRGGRAGAGARNGARTARPRAAAETKAAGPEASPSKAKEVQHEQPLKTRRVSRAHRQEKSHARRGRARRSGRGGRV